MNPLSFHIPYWYSYVAHTNICGAL
jgi:hypothetical protein